MSPIMQLIRWGFLAMGVTIVLLGVLLIVRQPNNAHAWYTAIAMTGFGGLQVGAGVVLGRAARGPDNDPSDRRDNR